MSVTKSRVSQTERGEVSTVEVVARYVQALGGRLQISAVFGDDSYVLGGTDTHAAQHRSPARSSVARFAARQPPPRW